MAFGKTFILSLVTFIGVTFGGWVLVLALSGTIDQFGTIITTLSGIADAFFGPSIVYPGEVFSGLVGTIFSGSATTALIFFYVFYILAPLLAAIVAGLVGEKKGEVFGAWFLTICVCMGVALTLYIIESTGTISAGSIVNVILGAVATGFLYGCIALLVSKSESF